MLPGRVVDGLHVFGEAAAPIADAGKQKALADARVGADAAANIVNVGADLLADIGNFVHKGDLGGQHRVGRILGELGAAAVHHDNGIPRADKRLVEGRHDLGGLLAARPNHHAFGVLKIFDGGPFPEKLGVGHHIKQVGVHIFADRLFHAVAGADGDGRFVDDDGIIVDKWAKIRSHLHDRTQVGLSVAAGRGRQA